MSRARINILIGLFTLHPHRCRHAGEHAGRCGPVSRRPQRNGQLPAVRSFFVRDAFLIAFVHFFYFPEKWGTVGGRGVDWLLYVGNAVFSFVFSKQTCQTQASRRKNDIYETTRDADT